VPEVRSDERGELFELIKLGAGGQVFFSITKPGIIRGNHYHTRKIERFCVIKGTAVIRLRRIGTREIKEYPVAPRVPQFVDIPIFHAHQIENTGNTDLFTLFWCNELFDQKDSDTYFEEV
jgi:UDP-2-acetamido-2,6-beta-L-arabino-hexul-4-ose reductase